MLKYRYPASVRCPALVMALISLMMAASGCGGQGQTAVPTVSGGSANSDTRVMGSPTAIPSPTSPFSPTPTIAVTSILNDLAGTALQTTLLPSETPVVDGTEQSVVKATEITPSATGRVATMTPISTQAVVIPLPMATIVEV
ncbi:MAG TPA: hypothetical protein VHL11_03905, partial [Phototrophicaceae bacterium]|nr:hypothetical protein [Phototrophicaceae bacterium]